MLTHTCCCLVLKGFGLWGVLEHSYGRCDPNPCFISALLAVSINVILGGFPLVLGSVLKAFKYPGGVFILEYMNLLWFNAPLPVP